MSDTLEQVLADDPVEEMMTQQTKPARLMVSPQEAADLLSVDRDTIFRWIKAGKLAASKLSPRIVRIRLADIQAMLDGCAL